MTAIVIILLVILSMLIGAILTLFFDLKRLKKIRGIKKMKQIVSFVDGYDDEEQRTIKAEEHANAWIESVDYPILDFIPTLYYVPETGFVSVVYVVYEVQQKKEFRGENARKN